MIIDNFGSTEDAITGYRVITRKKAIEFHFEESIVVLKDNGDGYDDYKQVYITKVMKIVYNHPDLLDFVMIYHPLSPENPGRRSYFASPTGGAKPAGIEDEVRGLIYEANNPVRYEVEESRQADLIIEAVPLEKLREGLPTKPGKTKRIYVVGRDL